jgi:hypothetical protein
MSIEVEMIPATYAIIDPRAMVIELLYTSIADIAMSTPGLSNDFAKRTKRALLKLFQ